MQAEHLWFRDAFEALFLRDLKGVLRPEDRLALERTGVKLDQLLPAYSAETLRAALMIAGPLVAPTVSDFEQQVELGRRLTRGYFDTLLGRPMASMMRLVGPDRGITRIGRSFRTLTNYLDAKLILKAEGEGLVSFSPVEGLAGFILGINQETGVLLSAPSMQTRVSMLTNDGTEAVMKFEWSTR